MRATLSVKSLRDALRKVACFILRRNTIPILDTFHFSVSGDQLFISGTNLDTEAWVSVPVMGAEQGSLCVPTSLFKLVKTLPNWDIISLRTVDDSRLVLDFPDGRDELIGFDADFPWIKTEGDFGYWTLPANDLLDAFGSVSAFMSTEETRYYLIGVFMRSQGDRVNFAAATGNILGSLLIEAPSADLIKGMIVRRDAVSALMKTLPRGVEVKVGYSDKRITFETDGFRVISVLIDGTYPDFARVIPKEPKQLITIPRAAWIAKLRRFVSDRVVNITCHGGQLSASMDSIDFGEMAVALPGRGGKDFEFGVNTGYMIACLRACRTDHVELAFTDQHDPIRLTDEAGMVTVVMPMRSASKRIELPEGAAT